MSARKAKTQLHLTDRALRDIAEIEEYSIAEWGKRIAVKYLAEFEAALSLLQEEPELLREQQEFSPGLRLYRVKKHIFVCDLQPRSVFVLTVIHASRDIPSRLGELEPTLAAEIELLRKKLKQRK